MPSVIWTIRASLLLWAAAVGLMIHRRSRLAADDRSARPVRILWTAAWLFYLIHVVLAFHLIHDWDHSDAWNHTAEKTERFVGFRFGGGILFNHALTLFWTVDVIGRWQPAGFNKRPPWYHRLLHGYMVFVIVNATVVFESGWTRWIGAAVLGCLATYWWLNRSPPLTSARRTAGPRER